MLLSASLSLVDMTRRRRFGAALLLRSPDDVSHVRMSCCWLPLIDIRGVSSDASEHLFYVAIVMSACYCAVHVYLSVCINVQTQFGFVYCRGSCSCSLSMRTPCSLDLNPLSDAIVTS